ncbi:MAG: recombinase family protein [Sphingobium sp.]|uniref:recombinase family protein n=1 Tax=Sphingobium sp. TaxID=1912891 RepID=UPI003BAF8924
MAKPRDAARGIRCAIYTRKSTEEGLEQSFNSLDAQREACAAYILSQRHEGWTLVPDYYDDGGYSGGNMDRPALKALLDEVAAGRVDVIVVYKVDRLTRSLSDFARIVDVLDKAGASFVSVTQSFNTTSSMGRLTLNVLLSFAQFEREVTGERIRDKIAASKAKGMWMGGPVPLGYRLENRVLHIEPIEAELIRHIFQRYLDLGSGRLVVAELDRDGHRSKARINRHGRAYGRQPISRGALYAILQNRLYIGEVVYKEHIYPGQHAPIIDIETFEAVQSRIALGRNERRLGTKAACPSLLAGLLWDGRGRRMTPSHAVKQHKRYRYYVSQTESHDDVTTPAWRISASELEALVVDEIKAAISAAPQNAVARCTINSDALEVLRDRCGAAIDTLSSSSIAQQRNCLLDLIRRIDIGDGTLAVGFSLEAIDPHLAGEQVREVTINMVRTGRQTKIVIPPPTTQSAKPNPSLLKLIAQAFVARAEMDKGGSFLEIAARLGCGREYLADLLRASYLSPAIIKAILEGRQPPDLSRKQLMQTSRIPLDWRGQETMFGFG